MPIATLINCWECCSLLKDPLRLVGILRRNEIHWMWIFFELQIRSPTILKINWSDCTAIIVGMKVLLLLRFSRSTQTLSLKGFFWVSSCYNLTKVLKNFEWKLVKTQKLWTVIPRIATFYCREPQLAVHNLCESMFRNTLVFYFFWLRIWSLSILMNLIRLEQF